MSKFRLANYVSILVVSRQFGHTEWGQIYAWVSEHGLFPFWFAFMQTAVNHQNIKQLNNAISLSKHTLFKINYLIYISFSQTWLLASYWAVLSYKIENHPKNFCQKEHCYDFPIICGYSRKKICSSPLILHFRWQFINYRTHIQW